MKPRDAFLFAKGDHLSLKVRRIFWEDMATKVSIRGVRQGRLHHQHASEEIS
ncbi:MAG: hypothetical protein M1358_06890 [Chloroflexi bacterium]|nr:hypothetical protein [Chloroflexota bacterium]